MKTLFILLLISSLAANCFSQSKQPVADSIAARAAKAYTYAYILIEGKMFSKKLKAEVDFGDTQEQIKAGKEYLDVLTNKRSYAAILNHMVHNDFELVEPLDYTASYEGAGGTSGIVFIMRKNSPL